MSEQYALSLSCPNRPGIIANYPRETYRHHDFEGVPFDYLPITA